MVPRIAAARSQAQRERHYPPALVHEMATAGLFRLKLPAKYGGAEVDHLTYYRVIERLARMDASVGRLVAISNEGAAAAGYLPVPAADEIYGPDPNVIVAGALKSRHAEVRQVDGGFRIRG